MQQGRLKGSLKGAITRKTDEYKQSEAAERSRQVAAKGKRTRILNLSIEREAKLKALIAYTKKHGHLKELGPLNRERVGKSLRLSVEEQTKLLQIVQRLVGFYSKAKPSGIRWEGDGGPKTGAEGGVEEGGEGEEVEEREDGEIDPDLTEDEDWESTYGSRGSTNSRSRGATKPLAAAPHTHSTF